jgi:4-alpha-glucanotransferase
MTSLLMQLARQAGIATHWTDAFGHEQEVSYQSLQAILKAMRFHAGSDQECRQTLAAIQDARDTGRPPALLTTWSGKATELRDFDLKEGAAWCLNMEHGGTINGRLNRGSDGSFQLPPVDQAGYHRLECGKVMTTLAVAPQRSFSIQDSVGRGAGQASPKAWGVSAQLYSLRRAGDAGLPDYTALGELACSAARQGAVALATSPVHAMFSAEPARYSPYGPSSRIFFNAFHIDPAAVAGPEALRNALAAIPDAVLRWHELDQGNHVNWIEAGELRLAILRRLFEQLHRESDSPRFQAFNTFCQKGGRPLLDHACFEALHAHLRAASPTLSGDWRVWPAELRDPHSVAVADFHRSHAEEIRFHQFLQWLAAEGCDAAQTAARSAGMPIGLISDLAVGAEPGGSQAWGLQSAMLEGLTIGAPPDLLSTQGQNWGLGALSPMALAENGYAPWLDMLRANMRYSGGIRIDHVLGMARLWLVPEGESAASGAYVAYPFEDLLRLTTLESVRQKAIVIGEDLGTVPKGFSQKLASAGILGIRALWFQRHGQEFLPPYQWPADAMATTSTHDLATLAGWWAERDIDWRERLDLFAEDAPAKLQRATRCQDKRALWKFIRDADNALPADPPSAPPIAEMLAFAGRTPSPLVMVPLEDLFGVVEQPNLPGTVDTHPNWQQRLPHDAVEMLESSDIAPRLAALRQARIEASEQSAHQP